MSIKTGIAYIYQLRGREAHDIVIESHHLHPHRVYDIRPLDDGDAAIKAELKRFKIGYRFLPGVGAATEKKLTGEPIGDDERAKIIAVFGAMCGDAATLSQKGKNTMIVVGDGEDRDDASEHFREQWLRDSHIVAMVYDTVRTWCPCSVVQDRNDGVVFLNGGKRQ